VVFAVLFATLWPFNPLPRNGATWLPDSNGLRFESDGLVKSTSTLTPPQGRKESFTIELLLSSAASRQTILTIYSPTRSKYLVLREYRSALVVTHDDRVQSDPTRSISFCADGVFRQKTKAQVIVSSGQDGTRVYVNGRMADREPGFTIQRDELAGEIDLGSAPVAHSIWRGDFYGLAVYSKELTPAEALEHYRDWTEPARHPDLTGALARYSFGERSGNEVRNEVGSEPNLTIPKDFFVPHKAFMASPASEFRPDWRYVHDLVINIVGFMPLGVIVCVYFLWTRTSSKAMVLTTLSCGFLSLTIEILQYFVPRRGSGWTDVITNSLGGLFGSLLVRIGMVRSVMEAAKLAPKDSIT
jgi:VanZ family protein